MTENFIEEYLQNLEKGEKLRSIAAEKKEREELLKTKMLAEAQRLMKEGQLHERTITVHGRQFWLSKGEGDGRGFGTDPGVEIHFALVPADGDVLDFSNEGAWGEDFVGLDEVWYPRLSFYIFASDEKDAGKFAVELAEKPFTFASAEDANTFIEAVRLAVSKPPLCIGREEGWGQNSLATIAKLTLEYFV